MGDPSWLPRAAVKWFELELAEQGVDVDEVSVLDNGDLRVEHVAPSRSDMDALREEIGTVLGIYTAMVAVPEWFPGALRAVALDPDREDAITWCAERRWVENFHAGAWSSTQLRAQVGRTVGVERVEEHQEIDVDAE